MAVIELRSAEGVSLLRTVSRSVDPIALLSVIGDRYVNWIDENFRREGAEVPWAPLRPGTIAGRRRGSSKVLQDTGRLRASATRQLTGETLRIGFGSLIAKFHHFGTRPFIIRPTRKRALRFMTAGGVRFARIVRHPGLPVRRLLPSASLANRLANEEADALVRRATKAFGRGSR